ncbi:unnamed protein product [Ixodes persulcatus]
MLFKHCVFDNGRKDWYYEKRLRGTACISMASHLCAFDYGFLERNFEQRLGGTPCT